MKGHIPAEILHRMCYNAKLFANKDSASQGMTLWIYGANGLRVASSDDYVILTDQTDQVDSYTGAPEYSAMEPQYLAELEKDLRGQTAGVDLEELMISTIFPDSPHEANMVEELMEMEAMVFDVDHWDDIPVPVYAIRADRLQKFSLIKPQQQPIDFKAFTADDQVVIGWKASETCRGLIAPLDRAVIREAGLGHGLW